MSNNIKKTRQMNIKTGTTAREIRNMEESFPLCPSYSVKQLSKINYLQTKKVKQGQRKTIVPYLSVQKQLAIKNAFNQEAIL